MTRRQLHDKGAVLVAKMTALWQYIHLKIMAALSYR